MRKLLFALFLSSLLVAITDAQIDSKSVVSQTVKGKLYSIENASELSLENSDERLLVSIITKSFNFRSQLFFDENIKSNLVDFKKSSEQLQGVIYYELSEKLPHTFKCKKAGEIIVFVDKKQTKKHSQFLNDFECIKNAVVVLTNKREFLAYRKNLVLGEILSVPAGIAVGGFAPRKSVCESGGEVLYNGIVLPKQWPPKADLYADNPMRVPYLETLPKVIPIDVGRQLFIDDFLIEKSEMVREFHKPKKYEGNPILKPETELEKTSIFGNNAVAAPLSGSILWNPEKQVFQMWYEAGHVSKLAYAESKDGLKWARPELDIEKGTNLVLPRTLAPDSWTVFNDYYAKNPDEKFKMFFRSHDWAARRAVMMTSADGIHWKWKTHMGLSGDRSTMMYNPFRKKWISSIRFSDFWLKTNYQGRMRAYHEADTFVEAMDWHPYDPIFWAKADNQDERGQWQNIKPQLYNLDGVAYESIMLGVFQILAGPENDYWMKLGLPKATGLSFAYSRDGFHWDRPDRRRVIDSEFRETWDRGYVQSISNVLCVVGDKLYIYYTGFAGDASKNTKTVSQKMRGWGEGLYSNGATGVAFLRRDGFASMNAYGEKSVLLTRPIKFSGSNLFVNADVKKGSLKVQIEDLNGNAIAPFTFENCNAFKGDSTIAHLSWKNADVVSACAGKVVRFRFMIEGEGKFYSFWVSRDNTGRSDGYVAGGGIGFTSDKDTVGIGAYKK